ncbi:MAG: hypothetical protein K9N23_22290 [Akkermansiaceae bacterium]|nr:hypothetical protein [Akkermansiaceae bacterium]
MNPTPSIAEAPVSGLDLPAPGFALDATRPQRVETLSATPPIRRWWRKRRFWGTVVAVLVVGCATWVAEYRGRQTRLIFVNPGSDPVPAFMVTAEGFTHTVPPLVGEASHRWVLPEGGVPAPVVILGTTATGVDWQWKSSVLQPGSGTRLALRVSADGTVEESSVTSFWAILVGD